MAYTAIADIVSSDFITETLPAEIESNLNLITAGIVDTQLKNVPTASGLGGTTVEMPEWDEIDDADEVLAPATDLTVRNMPELKDVGVICNRGIAVGFEKLAAWVSKGGDNWENEVRNQLALYVAKRTQISWINVLIGAVASLGASALNDVAVSTGTAVPLSSSILVDTRALLGDTMASLNAAICHSVPFTSLVKEGVAAFTAQGGDPAIYESGNVGNIQGMSTMITDEIPVDTTTPSYYEYVTYLVRKGLGAIHMNRAVELKLHDDALNGQQAIVARWSFIPHIKGIAWDGTAAGQSPTNAELATSGNWTAIYSDTTKIKAVAANTN